MKNNRKYKFYRFTKFFLISCTLVFTIIVTTFCILTYNLEHTMPQITNIELYDNEGNKYLSYSNNKKQSYVKLNNISEYLQKAFISIEDKRFYDHHGVDIIRIFGALFKNIKSSEIEEGGSTITQQYVKTLFLNSEQSFKRKINEAMIAIKFESMYSKDEILEGYLNAIYFDHGIYGVEDACLFYFNKHANEITLKEATIIASIPKGPAIYSPIKNPNNNKERAQLILNEMLKDKVITQDQYNLAIKENPRIIGTNPYSNSFSAPYFQDIVIKELENYPDLLKSAYKGLKVYTTLDSSLYNKVNESIKNRLPNEEIEIASYIMDPSTGYVLTIIGGKDYEKSTYNRAVYSMRQPASTIKPFLYLTAIENGFTPSTTFMSEETTFYFQGNSYAPHNYSNIYANSEISMLYAIATSDNIYAMKTHLFLGPSSLADTLKRFEFSGNMPANLPSLALGTKEVSLQELTEGYSFLANLGNKIEPTIITKVTTFDDDILYEAKPDKKRIADASDCYILSETMTSVFDPRITYNIRPTGAIIASMLSHKYAGKSGSTDTDNWMIGYSPQLVVGVWTGYDDNRKIEKTSEKRIGKYIWADVMEYYHKNNYDWYEMPSDVISIELNPRTGFYANIGEYTKDIYFRESNIPWYIKLLYAK